ncbi:hypothetical protein LTR84_002538 [Exophiala bonariae]|uniref:Major facilitator superfamily (MFS) profile domain-containing protein n=1 Tax=Exophiala bonariae TaxID=1690606 RepID=A0AAV9N9W8_9EURO|nr:hypothetical protein LTR84_002538 [Exophiala bonariae]
MFIVSRAVAGAGGAGIVSGIMTIVAHIIPLEKRPAYFALGGATFGMATISGPLIGGALTEKASWRWCFYINLPIGAVAAFVFIAFFHPPIRPNEARPIMERVKKLDLIGAALFLPSIVMLLLALQWGGNTYPWHSTRIIGLFCGFGGLLAVFTVWQLYLGDKAMIPPEFLTRRTIVATCLTSMCVFGSTFVIVYYLPEWFQVVKGASPIKSGVMNIALFVPQIIGSIIAGTMITKLGYCNPWILTGVVFSSIATGLYSTFKVNTGHAAWIGYQVLNGLGIGFSMETPLSLVQTVLKPEEASVGISLVTFSQFIGGSIFVAIAQTVFTNRFVSQLAKDAPTMDPQALLQLGTAALRKSTTPEELPAILHAFNSGITYTFYVAVSASSCAFLAASLLEWNSVKAKTPEKKAPESVGKVA